jgi:anti-sigma regulatory factor (Ser/Thr protein kinase)
MIDDSLDLRPSRAWNVPAALLVDDVARLCVASGLELCAIYPAAGSRDPLAFEQRSVDAKLRRTIDCDHLIAAAKRAGLVVVRQSIVINGGERAYAVFASRGQAPDGELIRSACALFTSTIAQTERLAYYHRVSDRLQRALLPARLAQAPGMAFDAAYSPGSSEAEVGGDWYDAFAIGDGSICISVGDVTGHGLDAAVTMSELRRAIRNAAVAHDSPVAALNAVDTIATSQGIGIASAVVGFLDIEGALLRYASAGHPAPILLTAKGRAFPLSGGGTLLGLGFGAASHEHTLTLSPGSSLVLYTDGLIEYDHDLLAGEERLLGAIEALSRDCGLDGSRLHEHVLSGGQRDDCATLIVSRSPVAGATRERYTFSAVPPSARLFRDAIRDFTERWGITGDRQFNVLIACGEAIANAIEHGDQQPGTAMNVELSYEDGALAVDIENRGHWRTSSSEHRGRGMGIMRAYAERLALASSSEKTRVSLLF